MNSIPVIDLILAIFIILMIIHGYVRGFVVEFFAWAALLLAIWAAVLLYPTGAAFIRTKIMQNVKYVPEIFAFAIIFIIVMMVIKMLEYVIKDVVEGAKLRGVNKVLGLIFGLIEGLTLTALILFILAIQPVFDVSKLLSESIFAQIMLPLIKIPLKHGKDAVNAALIILPQAAFQGPGPRFPFFPV